MGLLVHNARRKQAEGPQARDGGEPELSAHRKGRRSAARCAVRSELSELMATPQADALAPLAGRSAHAPAWLKLQTTIERVAGTAQQLNLSSRTAGREIGHLHSTRASARFPPWLDPTQQHRGDTAGLPRACMCAVQCVGRAAAPPARTPVQLQHL